VHQYQSPAGELFHCDFYRLKQGSELEELGGPEFFAEEKIYLLEWPERVRLDQLVESDRVVEIKLTHDQDARLASIQNIFVN
jgi:tRNA threonylcarbamoyl adenosine modification protein YjeE